jgi:hypothetical protein
LSIRQKLDQGSRSEQILKNPLALHAKKEEVDNKSKEVEVSKVDVSKEGKQIKEKSTSTSGFAIFSDESAPSVTKPKKREEKPASGGGFAIFSDESAPSVTKPKKREEKPASGGGFAIFSDESAPSVTKPKKREEKPASGGGFAIFSDESAPSVTKPQKREEKPASGSVFSVVSDEARSGSKKETHTEQDDADDIDFNFLDASGGENETINTKLAKIDIDQMFFCAPTPEKPIVKSTVKPKDEKKGFAIFNPNEQQVVSPLGALSKVAGSSMTNDHEGDSHGEIKNNNSMVFIDDSLLQFDATTEMPLPMHSISKSGDDIDGSGEIDLFRFSTAASHEGRKSGNHHRSGGLKTVDEEDVVGVMESRRGTQRGGVNSFYMSSSDEDISESKCKRSNISARYSVLNRLH